jgi:Na+/proline symporter
MNGNSALSAATLASVVIAYFGLLLAVAWRTSRHADNRDFFIGGRRNHWLLVAFGMVGTSLSGVTFISVPGAVGSSAFSYFQIVMGQLVGYLMVAWILLPLYYRLNLTSIYSFLDERLGQRAYRTGASFFILSRTLGATARLYLVVAILQEVILDRLGMPFWLTATVLLIMILLYTFEGGVKTIVWTDTLQTACMLGGLVTCTFFLLDALRMDFAGSLAVLDAKGLSQIIVTDVLSPAFFGKQFIAGIFIAITMTGMDQEMMQKNISVKTLGDAQKNMVLLALAMLVVVLTFLYLGGLLQLFAERAALAARGDALFPAVVMNYLPALVQLIFVIALISALFPSADGAITALTSSFCIDILGLGRNGVNATNEAAIKRTRHRVHLAFATLFLALVLIFKEVGNPSMIGLILKIATYTYGPLLGLFAYALLMRRQPDPRWIPLVAVAAPLICLLLDFNQSWLLGGYRLGLEILPINGGLTMLGLWLISAQKSAPAARH